jgi:hypothetical protein
VPLSELLLDIPDCPADAAVVIQGNVRVVVGSTATGYYEFILFDCILVCARATPLYHVFCFVNFFCFPPKRISLCVPFQSARSFLARRGIVLAHHRLNT